MAQGIKLSMGCLSEASTLDTRNTVPREPCVLWNKTGDSKKAISTWLTFLQNNFCWGSCFPHGNHTAPLCTHTALFCWLDFGVLIAFFPEATLLVILSVWDFGLLLFSLHLFSLSPSSAGCELLLSDDGFILPVVLSVWGKCFRGSWLLVVV